MQGVSTSLRTSVKTSLNFRLKSLSLCPKRQFCFYSGTGKTGIQQTLLAQVMPHMYKRCDFVSEGCRLMNCGAVDHQSSYEHASLDLAQRSLIIACMDGGLPFFLEFDTSQSVNWAQPRTKEPLQRKETQTKKGNTKYSQSTTILFSTLFFIYHFFETIQFESQEEK